ncbi:peptidyl-prolyl cis-trans isomerase CWC27 homolog [Orbicella faveolata]|uniref:peptidyl-prolyl cis-trans isomerase CWC27 homolog n=1 Tax=Orbicella faveolata TaxID=48498 RepID=UPI0009E50B13|nr:peptidyl-prolyl cis-trans isomerase CWC27 homolog [Orbicella faveolata]
MSNIYIQEPPTNGKVLLITTCGEIDIELWSKEAPKACRNFIQLCLEGYYDGTIFHRIVKGFCIQGGDPTGTGTGGESIYGQPFKDEFHQRLRFVRRGLVAMANAGPNDNQSQFFFTLGATVELNGKHTIFGKVAGDTIYNMLKMEDCEVDRDDRPLFPPKIKRTEVLHNPFDDIVLRQKKEEMKPKPEDQKKRKVKGTKNFSLLSFGEEAEEDESDVASVAKTLKMKSSHDVLKDPKLSSQPVLETTASVVKDKKKAKPVDSDDDSDEKNIDEQDFDSHMRDNVRNKLMKRKADNDDDDNDDDEIKRKQQSAMSKQQEDSGSKIPSARAEYKRLKREMMETKTKKDEKEKTSSESKESDVLAAFHAEQKIYLEKKKTSQKRKGEGRDEQTLALLASFQTKLNGSEEIEEEEIDDNEAENEDDDTGWMTHSLRCETQQKLARDAYIEDEDTFEIFDPRNPINKRRREASKKAMKDKRR